MVGAVMTSTKSPVAFSMKGNLGPGKLLKLDFVGGICGLGHTPWVLRHLSALSILSSQSLIELECCDIPGQFLGLPLHASLIGLLLEIPLLACDMNFRERFCKILSLMAAIADAKGYGVRGNQISSMGACAYVTSYLHFGFLARASFSEFFNQGAHNSPLIQKFFFAAYTTSCSKGGSLAQAALNSNFQGIQIIDMPYALATSDASISALFPCNAYTTPSTG